MKKITAGCLAAFLFLSSVSAQTVSFDAADFDDLPFLTDVADFDDLPFLTDADVTEEKQMTDAEVETLVRSIIKTEMQADEASKEEQSIAIQEEINRKVDEELEKYRAASDEYVSQLKQEMEKKNSDEIEEIKINYTLQLAEEREKLQKEYEAELKKQKAELRDEMDEKLEQQKSELRNEMNSKLKEQKALSDLERLLAMEEAEATAEVIYPFEHARDFRTISNQKGNSKVELLNTTYQYKGKSYKSLTFKGNTGTLLKDDDNYYDIELVGAYFNKTVKRAMKDANCIKFKLVGDGQKYQMKFEKGDMGFYYEFTSEAGIPKEIIIHKSMFFAFNGSDELDFNSTDGMRISYCPEQLNPNTDFEATFFDMAFVSDSEFEKTILEKKANPFICAEFYKNFVDEKSNGKVYVKEGKTLYEGKPYKTLNFIGNTGTPDKKVSPYYISRVDCDSFTSSAFDNSFAKDKTIKFKVFGDGQAYRIGVSGEMNGKYRTFEYKFRTKKGKISEVKINTSKLRSNDNSKIDWSKITDFSIAYEYNYDGQSEAKKDKNFSMQIFDLSIY